MTTNLGLYRNHWRDKIPVTDPNSWGRLWLEDDYLCQIVSILSIIKFGKLNGSCQLTICLSNYIKDE